MQTCRTLAVIIAAFTDALSLAPHTRVLGSGLTDQTNGRGGYDSSVRIQ